MGLFVVFEGPEGSGKTTQIRLLQDALLAEGRDVLCTREPGGTPIGEQIREILHAVNNVDMLPITEALLYSAARAQHVGEVIRPALDRGGFVVSDRYAYSTLAYQGDGHGLDRAMLQQMTRWATGGLDPDLVVYLDLEVTEGLRRKQEALGEGGEWNRMDQLDVTFHRAVRQGYLRMSQADPARWLVIDAGQPVEAIQREIRHRIDGLCDRSGYVPAQGG
ncbi:MAG: dTMP kinase [Anaerolineae bacterium]